MSEKNLIPFYERTESEQREIRKKGGKASGEARRRKAAMKSAMKELLSMPVCDVEIWNKLSAMGVPVEKIDNQTALLAAVLMRGIKTGDFKVLETVAAITGEDNDAERLKLMKRELSLKEKSKAPQAGETEIPQLYNALEADDDDV